MNKYDYFERRGVPNLYRVPAGQNSPVEFVCSRNWAGSDFKNVSELFQEGRSQRISAERAREISEGAPVDESPAQPKYYWYETGIAVSPWLLRVDPDGVVHHYIEPEHRESTQDRGIGFNQVTGWGSKEYSFSQGIIRRHTTEISEAEARQRRPAAFETPASAHRYFYNDTDVYRVTTEGEAEYWSEMYNAWTEAHTCLSAILDYPQISEWRAKKIFPDATIEGYQPPVQRQPIFSATISGSYENFDVKIDHNPGSFTLTVVPR